MKVGHWCPEVQSLPRKGILPLVGGAYEMATKGPVLIHIRLLGRQTYSESCARRKLISNQRDFPGRFLGNLFWDLVAGPESEF